MAYKRVVKAEIQNQPKKKIRIYYNTFVEIKNDNLQYANISTVRPKEVYQRFR